MLRITNVQTSQGTVLKLDGKLLSAWVEEVRQAYFNSRLSGQVRLDLSQVSFVDEPGVRLLIELLRQGASIAAQSNYVAELLNGALS
jgi:ABC-type transporter Mla MlaB component